MHKTKITRHQLFSLTACNSIGVALIAIPAFIASISKQDAWIAGAITPVLGIPVILIYWFLGSKYPDRTFVEIIKDIFGKWIGLFVAINYIFFYLIIGSHLPWYIGQFTTVVALPETPTYILGLLFMIAVVIGELYGIEAVARASEIFISVITILFFLAMILVLPNAKIENLQPILSRGITPIFKSSVFLLSFTTYHLITMMGIHPYHTKNMPKVRNSFIKGYLLGGVIIFTTIIMSILVLGSNITAKAQYPTFLLAKEISVGIIFTRLDFMIAIIWIIAIFIIGTMFFHAAVISFSQVLGLKDYRFIIIPQAFIMLAFSEIIFPSMTYYMNWIKIVWIPYSMTMGLVIPILLLLVLIIKRLRSCA